ncbi:MAG: SusC/RagA family TonB-linked outer membrane protein [Ginsengibacter sp.]
MKGRVATKLTLILMLFFSAHVNAGAHADYLPDNVIRGKITDQNGNPLAGASINLKGSNIGTSSDAQGNYVIDVPGGNGVLIFTNIGFAAQEMSVAGRSTIDVKMVSAGAESLSEVVVTALGIKREVKSLTYSLQSINGDKLNEAKDPNLINTLQGKVAGVTITRDATGPGGNSKVIIRGNRSLTGSSEPLYVIDGVPLNGGIGMLSPDNIESMTVLKGASAAALYGSEGQNGAIIITTKKPKASGISVDYNGGVAFDQAAIFPDLQYEYGQGDAGVFNANSERAWGPKATGQMVTLWNGDVVPLEGQKDRLKDFFRTGTNITNSIAVSGGSEKMQAYFSYGNTDAKGIMPNNDYSRHNVDLKVNANVSPKLTILAKGTYIYEDVNNRQVPGDAGTYTLPSLYCAPTSIPLSSMKKYSEIDASGNEVQSYWLPNSSVLENPYWTLDRVLYYQQSDRFLGLFSAKYDFTDWLNIQVRGSMDKRISNNNRKIYEDNYFSQVGSDYRYGGNTSQSSNVDLLVSFDHDLAKNFHLIGNVGGSAQQGNYSSVTGRANGLFKPNFFFMSNARGPYVSNGYGKNPQVQSIYGNASIDYKKMLYLDVTARNDWSSALPKNSQSYFYPSVGLSAIISEMVELPNWVSYGKARITFANSGFGGTEYLDRKYFEVASGGAILTPSIQSLGTYKPELTHSFETGLDWQFFNSRLGFNLTYYNTRTVNQLLLIGTPSASLFDQKYINAGLIKNTGIELLVNVTPIRQKNFAWDITANYSKNNNKIDRLTETISSVVLDDGDNVYLIKASVGGKYGEMYAKGWASDAQGRHLVEDDGTPVLTDGLDEYLGNYNPDYMLGVNNTISFKNFSLSFLIDHRQGGTVISGTQALLDQYGDSKESLRGREDGIILDGYTRDGVKNTTSISAQGYFGLIGGRYPAAGFYSYSSTNTRLRELTLGFRIPKSVLGKTNFIKEAKLSAVGRNLFFFQRSAPVDPEITRGLDGGGLEYAQLPSTRSYGVNLKLSF